MYDMTPNPLPAPYNLSPYYGSSMAHPQESFLPRNFNTGQMGMVSAMKRGGRAKSSGYTTVHMNPHEISVMEHLQGHTRYNKDGVREFRHLEELLKNPHILHNAHHHARQHHAEGGYADGGLTHEDVENLRQHGRFGDSTLANVGPHTQHFLNFLAGGHPTINPYTGHPEYWNIGAALRGIGNVIKGGAKTAVNLGRTAIKTAAPHIKTIARQALPAVLPMAQEALGNKFGGMGRMAGQALGNAATNALGPQEGPVNPYADAIGNALGRGVESYRGGNSASQAFGHGMQSAGNRLGGGMGSAMEGMGQSMGQGHGLGSSLRTGAQSGFNAMGGMQGLRDMGSQVAQGFGNGGFGGAHHAARQQIVDYRNRAMPQLPQPANDEMLQYA